MRLVVGEDRVVLCLRRMSAEGTVRSQGMLKVFQGDYQGSYEINLWPVAVDGTEIAIRRDDWDMDRLYGKAPAFGMPYNAARKLFPGITGAGFITQTDLGPWILRAGCHRTTSIHRVRVMK